MFHDQILTVWVVCCRTRTDSVRAGGRAALARLHGRGAPAGHLDRADAETGPAAEPAALGGATGPPGRLAQLHQLVGGPQQRPGPVGRRGMDRPSSRSHRMPFRHAGRSLPSSRRPEPKPVLFR